MATSTLLSITDRRNGTQWTTSWSVASSVTRIYCGLTGDTSSMPLYRNRITFNTNNVIISSSSKLIVECKVREENYYCSALKARLSQTTINPDDYYESASWTGKYCYVSQEVKDATMLASSAFKDSNGNTGIGSGVISNGTSFYFVFNLNNKIKQNQTYYIYLGQESSGGNYFTALDVIGITLIHETYTKCGAPSSVSLGGYIVPNGDFTVSWGAGAPGNANSISGYRISCGSIKPGSSRVYTQSFTAGKDDRSLKISASKITNGSVRGNYIYCKVQTLGSVSGYDSVEKESSTGITINSLPNQPTGISVSKSILPSTGGSITLKATPGTDTSNDNTPRTVYYSTSQTGAKTIMTNGSATVNVKNNTTFYFWTYDSLEYSTGIATAQVRINTKPTCNISLVSGNVEDTNSVVPSGYDYILSPTFAASKNNTTLGNNNSFSYYYRIYNNPGANPILESSYGSGESLSITDIRSILSISPPYYYSFGAKVNDGIESSDIKWSNKYYVTGAPAIINIYNTSSGNNIAGMGSYSSQTPFYFSKQLCFDFVYDTGYIGKNFALKNSSKSAQVGALSNKSCLRAFFNDCGITNFGEYILSGYFLGKADCSCQASRAMYRIRPFEIKNLLATNCKPHTNNYIYTSIASNTLGGAVASPKEFGIKAENVVSIDSFVGTLNYQNKTLTQVLEIDSNGSGGDTFKFKKFIYNHDSFGVNQNETYTMTFTLSLTNAFNETYSASYPIIIDYKEIPKINSIDIGLPNKGTNEIKEGQEITITISYENCYNSGQTLSFNTPYGTERVYLTKVEENKTFKFKVPEVQITREIDKLDFIITNNAKTSASKEVKTKIKFLKHTTPNVILTRTDYSESNSGGTTGDLIVYFSPSDWGLDPILQTAPGANNEPNNNIEISLQAQNGKKTLSFKYDENLKSCTFTNVALGKDDTWESVLISLEITVTSYAYHETTHTQQNTNTILVYNSTPTVAYRKNQLGINTKDPTGREKALVVIGGASGRNQIFYETNQDKPYCQVINFWFDGGTWGPELDNDDIGVIVGDLPSAEQNSF